MYMIPHNIQLVHYGPILFPRSSLLIQRIFWNVISCWLWSCHFHLLNMKPPNSCINTSGILPPYHSCLSLCFSCLHPLSFSFQRPLFPWEKGWKETFLPKWINISQMIGLSAKEFVILFKLLQYSYYTIWTPNQNSVWENTYSLSLHMAHLLPWVLPSGPRVGSLSRVQRSFPFFIWLLNWSHTSWKQTMKDNQKCCFHIVFYWVCKAKDFFLNVWQPLNLAKVDRVMTKGHLCLRVWSM